MINKLILYPILVARFSPPAIRAKARTQEQPLHAFLFSIGFVGLTNVACGFNKSRASEHKAALKIEISELSLVQHQKTSHVTMFLVSSDPDITRARLVRETWTVLIVYLGCLAHAYSYGFSAVAIPDIRNEMRETNVTRLIPSIVATEEQLSWFGEDKQ